MVLTKMTYKDWIEKYESFLRDEAIHNILNDELPRNEFKPWTFLKLAVLYSYIHFIYLPHIAPIYENPVYIDLFAGSGVSHDVETNTIYAGSPIIAATNEINGYTFKKCIFVEKNKEFADALRKRLEALKDAGLLKCPTCIIINGDCNDSDVISTVLDSIPRSKKHILLFVDPYGINFYRSTLEKFIEKPYLYFDMFLNFQHRGASRGIRSAEDALNKLYGDSRYWKVCRDGSDKIYDCLLNNYISMLKNIGRDKIKTIIPIEVSSGMGYGYALIFTTRKEKPVSGWINGINHLKDVVEALSGSEVHLLKTTMTLDDFMKKN